MLGNLKIENRIHKKLRQDFRFNVVHSSKGHDFIGLIEPSTKGNEILPWAQRNITHLKELLTKYGVLILRGFSANTCSFSGVADLLSLKSCKLQGQISPRTQIEGSVYTSTNFPAAYPIGQHHENCYDIYPPAYLCFYCKVPSPSGGETVVVDARNLYRKLSPIIIENFERYGVKYLRNFTSSSPYKTREATFLLDSKKTLEQYCKDHGIEGEWIGETFGATQVRGATTVHPITGNPIFFNVAHIWHWSSIVKAAQAFGGDIAERIANTPPDKKWGNAYYGDGSEIEVSVIDEIQARYQENENLISWQANDVVIIDNVIATHGRKPFAGERQIQVTVRAPSKNPFVALPGQPTKLWREEVC